MVEVRITDTRGATFLRKTGPLAYLAPTSLAATALASLSQVPQKTQNGYIFQGQFGVITGYPGYLDAFSGGNLTCTITPDGTVGGYDIFSVMNTASQQSQTYAVKPGGYFVTTLCGAPNNPLAVVDLGNKVTPFSNIYGLDVSRVIPGGHLFFDPHLYWIGVAALAAAGGAMYLIHRGRHALLRKDDKK